MRNLSAVPRQAVITRYLPSWVTSIPNAPFQDGRAAQRQEHPLLAMSPRDDNKSAALN